VLNINKMVFAVFNYFEQLLEATAFLVI